MNAQTSGFIRERLPDALSYFESQGLTLTGRGKWRTVQCIFHGGGDSMRVHLDSGAWVCMNCGIKGGDVLSYHMEAHALEFVPAARALGAYVEGRSGPTAWKPSAFSARAGLEVLAAEAVLVAVAAGNLAQQVALSDEDRSRLMTAAGRISFIAQEVGA